jgi:type IV pilus assembly protein PilA
LFEDAKNIIYGRYYLLINKEGKIMKKKQKGFTLIELLVVVAIIGILAAVGVVAYSGYTSGAKKSAAKSNHGNVVKYVAAEMKKCNIEGGSQMKDSTGQAKLLCSNVGKSGEVAKATIAAMAGEFTNPYETSKDGVVAGTANSAPTCSTAGVKGQTQVADDGNTFYVYTCFDDTSTAMSNQFMVE